MQKLFIISFNGSSRLLAENIEEDELGMSKVDLDVSMDAILCLNLLGDFDLGFSEKARSAMSRRSTSPSSSRASDQVKIFAWSGDMAQAILVTNLFHDIF
ncbi:hypothetical protein VTN49DRAFT_907 [Thermomyces lanuginosus]|uniref:uncharacterized protein n=1 Tax=Thermomyces lanuginosus TaxID=5541 RepID=UPI003743A500